ncbi:MULTISPECIES: SitI6 family double-CXXCG motif immunity protein [unclassified Corallococcus]|uniref:SitI6 family double-CXXCG motif immunity protein n=1 Tax=unclassified Corallococcus TaxID=2685029 RepID=UPI001A8D1948|nr:MULTISPECIES: double-CXXCG motif protein [unclassified Corallococcus]MBN9681400.1 double-CXXCG motif protein [Corallococcus sp. NCSPR001]WAS87020.1 double-CXXCG motif protein [Corallococcus sp. NCRR]
MTRYFALRRDKAVYPLYNGSTDCAHRWGLPGLKDCPGCGATWSSWGHQYPAVDLSDLPEQGEFEEPRPEPLHELARLRELVRPLAPPGAPLPPGTSFGPLVGTATGRFASFSGLESCWILLRRDAFDSLQAAGIRGLLGCKTELRFRQKTPPEVLELQLELRGRMHRDCLPPDLEPPCPTCGRVGLRLPEDLILDAASLPTDIDLFRLGDYGTVLIGTDRFKDAVEQGGWTGISFRELPVR